MKRIELKNDCYKKIKYNDKEKTKIDYEFYFDSKDEWHRLNDPARIWYYTSGNIELEEYCINDRLHRLEGPAQISYYESGEIHHEGYWINGEKYLKEEFYKLINIERNLKLLNKK